MISKKDILDNLYYRIRSRYPSVNVSLGKGVYDTPGIVVIQSEQIEGDKIPLGLLKVLRHMNLDSHVFLTTTSILQHGPVDTNLYYLKELLDILCPLVVVGIGDNVLCNLRELGSRAKLSRYRGKYTKCEALKRNFIPVYDPKIYGQSSGDKRIKRLSKTHWESIKQAFIEAKIAHVIDRWDCSQNEAQALVEKELA